MALACLHADCRTISAVPTVADGGRHPTCQDVRQKNAGWNQLEMKSNHRMAGRTLWYWADRTGDAGTDCPDTARDGEKAVWKQMNWHTVRLLEKQQDEVE
jgi:hypothetical protein